MYSAIAVTLIIYSWVPAKSALQQAQARIVSIVPYPATRYDTRFITADGQQLSCVAKGLRGWPPAPVNRCPIETLAAPVGETVTVLHDGQAVYEVRQGQQVLLSYSAFRWVQLGLLIVTLFMVGVAVHSWHKPNV